MEFEELYEMANKLAKEEKVEEHTYISEVAVAILSSSGKVYIGKIYKDNLFIRFMCRKCSNV